MSLTALIEKIITEHESSAILFKEHLELLRDQISALETENVALKSEIALLKRREDTIPSQVNKPMKEIEPLNQAIEGIKKDDTKTHLDAITQKILRLFFDKSREVSAEEIAAILSMDVDTARYHFDLLLEGKLIIQTTPADTSSWTHESTPALFELTYLGRKYVVENKPG